jgi:acetyltransferase
MAAIASCTVKTDGETALQQHDGSQMLDNAPQPGRAEGRSVTHGHAVKPLVGSAARAPEPPTEADRLSTPLPYPSHMVQRVEWQGRSITLRPIHPNDETQHLAFLSEMEPADIRMRIFHSRSSISTEQLRRLTCIDYQREIAFVAVENSDEGRESTLGVARAVLDPDTGQAEFGIVVRSNLKGRRLGELLMHRLIEHQRERGTKKMVATVLAQNSRMLEMARRLGFVESPCDEGDGVLCIELHL